MVVRLVYIQDDVVRFHVGVQKKIAKGLDNTKILCTFVKEMAEWWNW